MNKTSKNRTIWLMLVGLIAVSIIVSSVAASSANAPQMATVQNPPKVWITAGEPTDIVVRNLPPREFLVNAPQTASITVTYVGSWNDDAKNAFEYAVQIWETQITSSVEIHVQAEWANLGPGILGGAGAEEIFRDFPNAPVASTWYPVALANKIAGTDLSPGSADIGAAFNSGFSSWYFGTDGNPGGLYDFVSVVLHEIGHGLGFFGTMSVGSSCGGAGIGCWGYGTGYPSIYDRFTENGAGTALLSFPNNSSQLGSQLTSNDVYFDGPNGNFANGGARVPLYAPGTWQQGSSYSHLAESFNGTGNALMTYSLSPNEAQHAPGPVMLGMFTDMGWTTSGPTPTPTKTLTPTPLPTCTPYPPVTPVPTLAGSTERYLPIVQKSVINCQPGGGTLPSPTPTKTPTVTPTQQAGFFNIFSDNFEGTFPGLWQLFSLGTTQGFAWGKSDCQAYQSSFSAWGIGGGSSGQGYPCNSDYPLNIDNWMIYGPFSTVGLTAAELNFLTWFNTEQTWDTMCFLASGTGGTDISNYDGYCWSGNSQLEPGNVNGWVADGLNLANIYGDGTVNLLGDNTVWVAFNFYSDFSEVLPTGAFVDDVLVRGCATGCTSTFAPRQETGPQAQKISWPEFQSQRAIPK